MTRYRPTVAIVDLDAIRRNVRSVRPASAALMAVVKADGYGHGALPVARAAIEAGATWLAVALVEEGVALRDGGIEAPVLVLSEFPRGSEVDALMARLTPTVVTPEGVDAIAAASRSSGRRVAVHVKVDTGMHRVGVWPPGDALALARRIAEADLDLEGVFTHFPCADADDALTAEQAATLVRVVDDLRAAGLAPSIVHAANSAAAIRGAHLHLDAVRIGAALYGLDPGEGLIGGLEPAMALRSRITYVRRIPAGAAVSYGHRYRVARDSTIATVPMGYGDGYPRAASPGAQVLIGGRRFPIAGTITMDHLLVDCGDEQVRPDDEVVLLGEQQGERITAEEIAAHAGTIGYEIVTRVSPRVPREYRGEA